MLAQYTVTADVWTDMPEAQPRARARVKRKTSPDATITVMDDGSLSYAADADIEIDTYDNPKYSAIKAEKRLSVPIGAFAAGTRVVQRAKAPKDPKSESAAPRKAVKKA